VSNLSIMEMSEIIRRGGGMAKLAKAIGLHRASLWYWTQVPPNRVKAVAAATGIPAHELRPDLWDAPDSAPTPPPAANDAAKPTPKRRTSTNDATKPSPKRSRATPGTTGEARSAA
jgi:hypothetical protein